MSSPAFLALSVSPIVGLLPSIGYLCPTRCLPILTMTLDSGYGRCAVFAEQIGVPVGGASCDTGGVSTQESPSPQAVPSGGPRAQQTRDLSRFAYLSIAAALVTITLKVIAWQ